jgi:hypothetical protein
VRRSVDAPDPFGSQRAATPVDSHLVDGRTGTDCDVLACHWLDLAGIASLRPPAKPRNVDHPPAAVAGDVDIEARQWSLSDEAVGDLHSRARDPPRAGSTIVSSRDRGAVVGASPWLENRAARAGEGSPARACLDGRFVTYEQRCQLTQPDPRTVIDR